MSENRVNNPKISPRMVEHPLRALVVSLVIMVIFDQLSWQRQIGMQFFMLILLILLGVFILTINEKKALPWRSYLLLIPILIGAVMTMIFRAGIVTFFNIMLTLSAMVLFALSMLNGQWMLYRVREVLLGLLLLIQSALIDPVRAFIQHKNSQNQRPAHEKNATWLKIWPLLRGLLIAIPVLLLFSALLASADLIFRERLSGLLDVFKIENLAETIFRAFYIIILAYFLSGAYLHALTRSAEEKTFSPDEPIIQPFLGHVEAFTVLILVNLLFLGFLIIQFRYFFAGAANISLEGFTYADYARRGFFELVTVAIISLGLHYLFSMVTKRADRKIKRVFSVLALLLMLQVGLMLISAFQRLSLYEAAYGFTTLRTITHIFMIWLGVLIAAVALMEIFNQFRRLALVLLMVLFGFTLTLNLLNVDRFIAQRNIAHAIAGNPLDANYLVRNLSDDAIPTLFAYSQGQNVPQKVKEALGATLACRYAIRSQLEEQDHWTEWNLARSRAERLFDENQAKLASFPFIIRTETYTIFTDGQEVDESVQNYFIEVNGEEIWCLSR